MTGDPFGTEAVRGRVLAGWTASPARFREDANAEEDQALGGYRDRLVVELAQNAADAATRAGVPGRLLLTLTGDTLVAANTGAPLDAAGAEGLATLRASAKRQGSDGSKPNQGSADVGRFGVGFSAVLSVSDEPAVISRTGGVRFSRADTHALVEAVPELHGELRRRDGHVPTLRLPFATEGGPPQGYDTAVLLPLRDAGAAELVTRLLTEVDDALLLALPALTEVVIRRPGAPEIRISDAASRWHVLRRSGHFAPQLLADRPTEERARTSWQVTWALPREDATPVAHVLHSPTPSDEPLPWRALLVATFPSEPSRRHVAPGPATDALVYEAAVAYADLLAERAEAGEVVWELIPTGLPSGTLDGDLREALHRVLPDAPVLLAAEEPHDPLRPRDAVAMELPAGADPDVVAALAPTFAGLVLAPRSASPVLTALGVRRMPLADVVESLPSVPEPEYWNALYTALTPLAVDPRAREALSALPVPLADGRLVRGVRGVMVLPPDDGATPLEDVALALAPMGVRVADPAAASPLLVRLGAQEATARTLLDSPAVHTAVEQLAQDDVDDPDPLVDAVLALAAAAAAGGQLHPGDLPWLGELPLPDEEGELAAAATLCVSGSLAAELFDRDAMGLVDADCLERWGVPALTGVGVLAMPVLLRAQDVTLDDDLPGEDDPASVLPDWDEWAEAALTTWGEDAQGVRAVEIVALRDLDALAPDALARLVTWAGSDREARRALLDRTLLVGDGRRVPVLPYTAWWLRRELAGDRVLLDPDGDPSLAGLLEAAPAWLGDLDPAVRRALGAVHTVEDLDAAALPGVLTALADRDRDLDAGTLLRVVRRLAELVAEGADLPADPPPLVRVPDGEGTRVVPAEGVVVADSPMYRRRADLGIALSVPPALAGAVADLLDVPLAADVAAGVVDDSDATPAAVPEEVRRLLPAAPAHWTEHDDLRVDGETVDWWITPAGAVHASTTDGLARALAWSSGRWELRAAVAEVLADPASAVDVTFDEAFS